LKASVVKQQVSKAAVLEHAAEEEEKRSRTIVRLFLSKRKSTSIVSKARKNKLACLILVIASYRRFS
jgi:hypothetical protein